MSFITFTVNKQKSACSNGAWRRCVFKQCCFAYLISQSERQPSLSQESSNTSMIRPRGRSTEGPPVRTASKDTGMSSRGCWDGPTENAYLQGPFFYAMALYVLHTRAGISSNALSSEHMQLRQAQKAKRVSQSPPALLKPS